MLKILFLGLNYAPEQIGIGLYSGDMAAAWAERGHAVSAVVAQPYYPAWKVFDGYSGGWKTSREGGVAVTRCPLYVPARPSGLKRILHHVSFLASATVPLVWKAVREKPDVVFTVAPSLIAAPAAWLAARLSGAKCWLHIQDFELEAAVATGLVGAGPAARAGSWFERTLFRLFDRVSSISPQMCSKLLEKGVEAGRTYQLRNWADIDGVRPLEGRSSYRDEWVIETPHVALYSGNIANKQGIEIVLEAARLLKDRGDLTFVVCGQGPNRANLEAAAGDLGNIQFHDLQPRERLGDLLGMASVHLMPQLPGAADLVLPSKLTNMLASGRPVVATAAPDTGLADEVEGCGLITPPGDAPAFAQGIARLLDEPSLAAAMGAAARDRAEERWAKGPILDRLDERLEGVSGTTVQVGRDAGSQPHNSSHLI